MTTVFHLSTIAILGALIYSNTLTAAFQFDDKLNIVDNLFIRNIGNLWPPSGSRWFGLLTFSLNYMVGGLNPVGYHLVNICIHVLTALSVYLFVLLTFRTPYFSVKTNNVISSRWFAFACALVFVAHPIQTQAVTYIVQRFASLATLLFILSLDLYVAARLIAGSLPSGKSRYNRNVILLYASAFLAALASIKTKENAFTLPFVILMYDLTFMSDLSGMSNIIKNRWRLVVSLSVILLAAASLAVYSYDLQSLFYKFRATNEITRHDYLITQFRVIVTYIRILFVPLNQTIDHHFKVYNNVFEPAVFASLTLILLLLCLAGYLLKISRNRGSYLRLVAFGIFWFFITLSIESSIIPIIDVMFEHRLYLPSIGVVIAVVAMFAFVCDKPGLSRLCSRKYASCILAAVVVALSCTAYLRNNVWRSELSLWSDAIAKKPFNPRAYNMVGIYYQDNSRIFEAIHYFRKALEVDHSYAEARSNLGNAYIHTGRVDDGLNELMITAKSNRFDAIDTGILYYNIGKGLFLKGMTDQAIENLNKSLYAMPNEASVYFLLGQVYKTKNMTEKSATFFEIAHNLNPGKF